MQGDLDGQKRAGGRERASRAMLVEAVGSRTQAAVECKLQQPTHQLSAAAAGMAFQALTRSHFPDSSPPAPLLPSSPRIRSCSRRVLTPGRGFFRLIPTRTCPQTEGEIVGTRTNKQQLTTHSAHVGELLLHLGMGSEWIRKRKKDSRLKISADVM